MPETLIERINHVLATAMRAQDRQKLAPLRMLKTALVNRRVDKGGDLTDDEALKVVSTLVKQRHDSVEQFTKAGRSDLATVEAQEIAVLERYLPPPVDADAIALAVDAAIAETGASSVKELGAVMKRVMADLAGRRVDGKVVNQLVRSKLGA